MRSARLIMGLLVLAVSTAAHGADIDKNAALIAAANSGDRGGVEWFLYRGAEVNAQDKGACTALMAAAFSKNLEIAKFLMDKGANVNARDKVVEPPL